MQESGSNRIASKTHSLSSRVQFARCLVHAVSLLSAGFESNQRAIGHHQDMNAIVFHPFGNPAVLVVVVHRCQAGQNCWWFFPRGAQTEPYRAMKVLREEVCRADTVQILQIPCPKTMVSSAIETTFNFWEATKSNSNSPCCLRSLLNSLGQQLEKGFLMLGMCGLVRQSKALWGSKPEKKDFV